LRLAVTTRIAWRRIAGALSLTAALLLPLAPDASAQVSDYGQKQMGPVQDVRPSALDHVSIKQRLNQQIPLNLKFHDASGRAVTLGQYFGKKPVILSLVYYQCKILCPEEINGLVGALEMVKFTPGKDFNVVLVSIDPTETPAIAAAAKKTYLARYGRAGTASGWHFLTGDASNIDALASAVGFGYLRVDGPDGKLNQYAHASAIELLTPQGILAQYYLGVEFSPKDIQLGLVEASHGQIGSPVDNILTYCYRYDPQLNRHSLIIARIVQAGCLLTMLLLGGFMVINFRRDVKNGRKQTAHMVNG
jgi:protein SCO1/2